MSWTPPDGYCPFSDQRLRELLAQIRLAPRSTAYRIYQVVAHRKEPVLVDSLDKYEPNLEEFTPAQARLAFEKRWVPARWITRFLTIAQADGDVYLPVDED